MERVDYESMVVQDFLNAHDRNELNVSPWYQRRAVWSTSHKAYLINSIFVQMPVPAIYIRHTLDLEEEKTIKEVVDGQQRVRSIIEYKANAFTARHPDHAKRVYYRDLRPAERQTFLMAKLPVAYLIGADDADVIEIFGRLNAVSKTLNAQEKRAAQFSGEFHQFCLREAVDRLTFWRGLNIFTATAISRMAEVQFMAELCMALVNGMDDFSAARITKVYKAWDDDFPERTDVKQRLERVFVMMRLFDEFQEAVSGVAARLACGASYGDGSSPRLLTAAAASTQGAMTMFAQLNRARAVSPRWSKVSYINETTRYVLDASDTFLRTFASHSLVVSEMQAIRNRIAHSNRKSRSAFATVVRRYYGANLNHLSPGVLLLSPRFSPTLLEAYVTSCRLIVRDCSRA